VILLHWETKVEKWNFHKDTTEKVVNNFTLVTFSIMQQSMVIWWRVVKQFFITAEKY